MRRTVQSACVLAALSALSTAIAADASMKPSAAPLPPLLVDEKDEPRAAVKQPASVDAHDLERNRKHHAALSEKNLELERLRAEVKRLHAAAEMCQAGLDKRVAAAPPPPPVPPRQ